MEIYIDLTNEEALKGCVKSVSADGQLYYIEVPSGTKRGDLLYIRTADGSYTGNAVVNNIVGTGRKSPVIVATAAVIVVIAIALYVISNTGGGWRSGSGHMPVQDQIQKGLDEIVRSQDYINAENDVRGELIDEYLKYAADEQLTDSEGNTVIRDSIERNDWNSDCIYTDSSGGLNVVLYDMDMGFMTGPGALYDTMPEKRSGNIKPTRGIMLYGLEDPGAELLDGSEKIVGKLKLLGSDCTLDNDVTVADYMRCFSEYDYVLVNCHGSLLYYSYGFRNESLPIVPVICTLEDITDANKRAYAEDISEQRIAKVTTIDAEDTADIDHKYWILPSFFENHYSGDGMNGTYVHLGICDGFGSDIDDPAGINYSMGNAFLSCGAKAVTGYYNTVLTSYDYSMISMIMTDMLTGKNLGESVERAEQQFGRNDEEYAEMMGMFDTDQPDNELAEKYNNYGIAYMIVHGEDKTDFLNH